MLGNCPQAAAQRFPVTILASDASRSELLELTAARGFAALMVVIFHIDAYAQGVISSRVPLDVLGLLAVDFFFVLSGFVLAHVYEGSWRKGTYDHFRFLIRRFARIWPLHMAGLIAVAAIVFGGRAVGLTPPWSPTASSFAAHVAMLHATGITPELAWNQPSWSVGAEWTAYLTFPLYLMASSRLRSPLAKLAGVAMLFALCWGIAKLWLGRDLMTLMHDGGALRIVPSFFLGVVLREIFGVMTKRPGPLTLAGLFGLTFGAAGALLAFGAGGAALWPLVGALVLLLALRAVTPEPGLLRARPLTWFGEISYALYIVHAPVLMVTFGVAGKLLGLSSPAGLMAVGLAGLAAAVIAAAIAHYVIEKPARDRIIALGDAAQGWRRRPA